MAIIILGELIGCGSLKMVSFQSSSLLLKPALKPFLQCGKHDMRGHITNEGQSILFRHLHIPFCTHPAPRAPFPTDCTALNNHPPISTRIAPATSTFKIRIPGSTHVCLLQHTPLNIKYIKLVFSSSFGPESCQKNNSEYAFHESCIFVPCGITVHLAPPGAKANTNIALLRPPSCPRAPSTQSVSHKLSPMCSCRLWPPIYGWWSSGPCWPIQMFADHRIANDRHSVI